MVPSGTSVARVVDARLFQQLAAHRVLRRLAGLDRALGQLHAAVLGVVEHQEAAVGIDQAGAGLEDRACRHTLRRPRARP